MEKVFPKPLSKTSPNYINGANKVRFPFHTTKKSAHHVRTYLEKLVKRFGESRGGFPQKPPLAHTLHYAFVEADGEERAATGGI